jgi:hypothetical protein
MMVQTVLNAHNKGADRTRKHDFLLNGLLFCKSCGSQLSGERHKKESGLVHDYYRCMGPKHDKRGCRQPYIPRKKAEEEILLWFKSFHISESYLKALDTAFTEIIDSHQKCGSQAIKALKNRRVGVEMKMSKLEDLLMEGVVTTERASPKYTLLKQELDQIDYELAQAKDPRFAPLKEDREHILSFLKNLADIYRKLDPSNKKLLLRNLFSKVWIENKQVIRFSYTGSFQGLVDHDLVRIREKWLPIRDLIRTVFDAKCSMS